MFLKLSLVKNYAFKMTENRFDFDKIVNFTDAHTSTIGKIQEGEGGEGL